MKIVDASSNEKKLHTNLCQHFLNCFTN
uniref:Uncharacterized protein n=1 Tax=Arundo donax TaxID=35708 RepID=A0A0A9B6I2_ARUDO